MTSASEAPVNVSELTLTGFLLARIAEDEAAAHAASRATIDPQEARWHPEGQWVVYGEQDWEVADASVPTAPHIARHDPARVLAECEAKRRIVAELGPLSEDEREFSGWTNLAERQLQKLAAVYADHEDFRPEWRI